MAKEIIDSPLTETWLADTGDHIVVAEGGSILTDDTWAITDRTSGQTGIALVVRGKLSAADSAIGLFAGSGEIGDTVSVRVAATGVIAGNGRAGIWIENRVGADVSVAGTLENTPIGMILRAPDTNVSNTGTVSGTQNGIYLESSDLRSPQDRYTVSNSGIIESGTSRALTFSSCGGKLVNPGTIIGDYGIFALDALQLTIRNEGLIHANLTRAMEFYFGEDPALVVNGGTISSEGLTLRIDQSELRIFNSGKVLGSAAFDFGENAKLYLRNSGEITGSSYFSEDGGSGKRHIVNDGTITGDLNGSDGSAEYRIVNNGLFDGDIAFSWMDSVYDGRNGKITGIVTSGGGNNKFIGGNEAERFEGDWGTDRMQGNGGSDELRGDFGNDILKGGAGEDLLEGGGGDDRLRGDAGSDVFVFGFDSGADTVVDFEGGTDLLRISNHAGGFAALGIVDAGRDLSVTHDGGTILLLGMAGATLGPGDFEFV